MARRSVAKREAELCLDLELTSGLHVRDDDVERIRAARLAPSVRRGSDHVAQLVHVAAYLRRIVIDIDAGNLNAPAPYRVRFDEARRAADDLAERVGQDVDALREHERRVQR